LDESKVAQRPRCGNRPTLHRSVRCHIRGGFEPCPKRTDWNCGSRFVGEAPTKVPRRFDPIHLSFFNRPLAKATLAACFVSGPGSRLSHQFIVPSNPTFVSRSFRIVVDFAPSARMLLFPPHESFLRPTGSATDPRAYASARRVDNRAAPLNSGETSRSRSTVPHHGFAITIRRQSQLQAEKNTIHLNLASVLEEPQTRMV